MQAPVVITGPLHTLGVRTPEEYLERQRQHIAALRAALPEYSWREPWTSLATPAARISGGRWIVDCPCGNANSASHEWMLALCYECGAIYRSIVFPENREAIEQALLLRPEWRNRHWAPPETLDDLLAENAAHGVA